MRNNAGDANIITREYLDSILFEQRLIGSSIPSTELELFGKTFSTPIMTPAFSHLGIFGGRTENGLVEYSRATKELNAVNWVGMMENDGFEKVIKANPDTIRIVKPYADREKIFNQLAFAEEKGALAVGMDTDHIFGNNGKYDIVIGEAMDYQSKEMIEEYVNYTKKPFVIKGVLSVRDAALCAEAGVKGIVVSHHHGRLPFAVPPLMVLREIVEELKHTGISVFVDCSIDSGFDAFKALALGADAVSVGRAMLPELEKEGIEGAKKCLTRMTEELAMAMTFTNFKTLDEIDSSVLWDKHTGKRLML